MDTPLLISIVDDDASVRESLCLLFRSLRFRVESFASAEEFLVSDRIHDTECLILDVGLPGMGGLELQRRLMANQPQMPVIFISAHDVDELRRTALEGGAIDYLLKPLGEEPLLNAVQTALRGKMTWSDE